MTIDTNKVVKALELEKKISDKTLNPAEVIAARDQLRELILSMNSQEWLCYCHKIIM